MSSWTSERVPKRQQNENKRKIQHAKGKGLLWNFYADSELWALMEIIDACMLEKQQMTFPWHIRYEIPAKRQEKINQNSEAVCQVQWHKLVIRNSISSTVQNEEEGSLKLLTLLSGRLTWDYTMRAASLKCKNKDSERCGEQSGCSRVEKSRDVFKTTVEISRDKCGVSGESAESVGSGSSLCSHFVRYQHSRRAAQLRREGLSRWSYFHMTFNQPISKQADFTSEHHP